MRKPVAARAPLRADLAGGTLDLWPLGCFHPGSRTVNVSLDGFATCRVESSPDGAWHFESADFARSSRVESLVEAERDPASALLARLAAWFEIDAPCRIITRSDSPIGAGLGGSSALAVAAFRAFERWTERPETAAATLVAVLRDLEATHLGKPAGVQDFWGSLVGGPLVIEHRPGEARVRRLTASAEGLHHRLLFVHTGRSHFSAENNWEIFRKRCEGDGATTRILAAIAAAAGAAEESLDRLDWAAFAAAVDAEWSARRQLAAGIVTPEMAALEATARAAGAATVKTCGAGGGGVLLIVAEPERYAAVEARLRSAATGEARVLPLRAGLDGAAIVSG